VAPHVRALDRWLDIPNPAAAADKKFDDAWNEARRKI
jgi:hypothetical protein